MKRFTRRHALLTGVYAGLYASSPNSARSQISLGGKWQMAPPMPKAMGEVVGVAVDRSLYVFGGLNDAAGEVPYGAAFRFDSEKSNWSPLRDMPQPAHHLMASAHDGNIYIFGGFTLGSQPKMSWQPTAGSWEYSPGSNTYKRLAPLPRPCGAGYAVTVGDKIYVIGGVSSSWMVGLQSRFPSQLPVVKRLRDSSTNTIPEPTHGDKALGSMAVAAVNGVIHAVGGAGGTTADNRHTVDVHYVYDPQTDKWTNSTALPFPREHLNLIALNEQLYAIGGRIENFSQNMQTISHSIFATKTPNGKRCR